jgi:hypothetical protein
MDEGVRERRREGGKERETERKRKYLSGSTGDTF